MLLNSSIEILILGFARTHTHTGYSHLDVGQSFYWNKVEVEILFSTKNVFLLFQQ